MTSYIKNRVAELEKEVEELEARMLKAHDAGSVRVYNNLKNEQWEKINEIKNLKARLGDSDDAQKQ